MALQLNDKDLALIRERLLANFSRTALEKAGWLDRAPDADLRRQLAELDLEFFCRFYLADHFSKPAAKMHRVLFNRVQKMIMTPGRMIKEFVLPRGFGKTTTVTLGLPLWCIAFNKRHHVLIISDSFDQAKDQLGTLKKELEQNERFMADFGDLKGPKWQEEEIITSNDIKVAALGARMKIRGRKFRQWRPDLIIVDDIENLEAVRSPMRRADLHAWFTRDVVRAGWDDTKILLIGNYIHFDCLLIKLSKNPLVEAVVFKALESWPSAKVLWDEWKRIITNLADDHKEDSARAYYEAHKAEMDEGGVSAWPEAFPLIDLMTMRVSEGEASFSMELQNDPVDPEKRMFKHVAFYRKELKPGGQVWLVPLNGRPAVPLSMCAVFGFTDPSMGKTQQSDYSAILVGAKAPTRQQFVLEADIKRRPPDVIMNAQIEWARLYPITRWGIENVQFQALYATESARRSMEAGVYLPVLPVNQVKNKDLRIQSLQPDLENEYILLPEFGAELLLEQLAQWSPGANYHDDGPDALEGLRNLMREWEPLEAIEVVQTESHQFGERTSRPMTSGSEDPFEAYEEAMPSAIEDALQTLRQKPESPERDSEIADLEFAAQVWADREVIFVPTMRH